MRKKKKEEKKTNIVLKIISLLSTAFLIVTSSLLVYRIIKIDLIPNKYIIMGSIGLGIVNLIFLLVSLAKRKTVWKIINIILAILIGACFIFGIKTLHKSEKSIEILFEDKDISTVYYVFTTNESEYDSLDKLKGMNIGLMEMNSVKVMEKLNTYGFNFNIFNSIGELTYSIDLTNEGIILSEGVYEFLSEEDEEYVKTLRKIYEFDITITKEEVKEEKMESTIDVGNSFLVYLMGVDASGVLTDVNILIAVNPDTHKILLVHIPRDYYVQVYGTTGLKEKLTHAGFYGINTQIRTMNQIFNLKVDSYVRVNFKTVTKIVDSIGGIDVYSDTAFNCGGKYIQVGSNHLNGNQALCFARQRKIYAGGDRHRGQNQEAVITAIIKKVSTNKNLLLKYDQFLAELSPYVTTNVDINDAKEMVKKQIDTLATWNVSSVNVNGSNAMNYTASYPRQYTYVMIPDQSTVANARNRIMEVMSEK